MTTVREVTEPLHHGMRPPSATPAEERQVVSYNAGIDAVADAIDGLELVLLPRALIVALANDLLELEAELERHYSGGSLGFRTVYRQAHWPAAREIIVAAREGI